MEEKSPNPPPINLSLQEACAHSINGGPGLWSELGKGEQRQLQMCLQNL